MDWRDIALAAAVVATIGTCVGIAIHEHQADQNFRDQCYQQGGSIIKHDETLICVRDRDSKYIGSR